jgi:DNA polymerase III delta subunit
MLYVIIGDREKLLALIEALKKKRPDAAILKFDEESIISTSLDELIYGQGLFSSKSIVVLQNTLTSAKDEILGKLKDIANSENIFVVSEDSVDTKVKAKFAKYAHKVQERSKESRVSERFNIFSLTDALGKRSARDLWVLYQKAKYAHVSDEEVHGVLFWQVKALLLATKGESAKEVGLNPFVYRKAQGFLKHYSQTELTTLSRKLVRLYHDARRGRVELGVALERFILAL